MDKTEVIRNLKVMNFWMHFFLISMVIVVMMDRTGNLGWYANVIGILYTAILTMLELRKLEK